MTEAVRELTAEHPGRPVYVIGHSLGAAMATIAAVDLRFKLDLTDVRLYTFGSPRVGNQIFSKFVRKHTQVILDLPF
jgi:predicted lipase